MRFEQIRFHLINQSIKRCGFYAHITLDYMHINHDNRLIFGI